MQEIWEKVEETEHWYVSDQGRVKNDEGIFREARPHPKGYLQISLEGKNYLLHRLVAQYFCENPENKPCVDHIDGNKTNCVAFNLRWVTIKENNNNPNTKWKNARPRQVPWNKGKKNCYSEETLAKMRIGSLKGGKIAGAIHAEKCRLKRESMTEEELLNRTKEYTRRYNEKHREELREKNRYRYWLRTRASA